MLSWILNIEPKLNKSDLDKMDKMLTSRFAKIAKGFGKGLFTAIKGGGIVGLEVEVANTIVERQVRCVLRTGLDLLDGLEVDLDGFPPILLLLELPRAVFELFQTHAASGGKEETGDRT